MNLRLKELAEQVGVTFHPALGATYTYGKLPDLLERFAELVRADEREACAGVCSEMAKNYGAHKDYEDTHNDGWLDASLEIEAVIRSMGEK